MRNGSTRHTLPLLAGTLTGILALTACAGAGEPAESAPEASATATEGSATPTETAGDPGGTVLMWTRAATSMQSEALVEAYNATHETQVELTVVPTDNYLQKVGVAAGAGDLPCLLASDVVYMPNFIDTGLFLDITDRVAGLPFADALAPGHMELGTDADGAVYSLPHTVSISAIFQNDVLLEQAGIDPAKEIETLAELAQNAEKVAALGDGAIGAYYISNNAGAIPFSFFPAIWASGGETLSADGTESLLDSPEAIAVFQWLNDMDKSGATPASVREETGATRNDLFGTGKVGYMFGNNIIGQIPESDALRIGVQGMPGIDGGKGTFSGGDVLGISAGCESVDAAWDFLAWSVSDEAQMDVYAPLNQLSPRTDLAADQYALSDPRVQTLNELVQYGRTPKALNYGRTYNDVNGPALSVFREAIFGESAEAAIKAGNDAITASLQ